MEPSGTEATLFQLVDVAGVGGDASYGLPDARLWCCLRCEHRFAAEARMTT